jgi:hypothetical protein
VVSGAMIVDCMEIVQILYRGMVMLSAYRGRREDDVLIFYTCVESAEKE